jgi:dTDP-4-amino-4,6-dideoxygalactose transaminase
VHVFGNACEVERIQETANEYNLKVIYDAAHAFGVKYKDQSIANYGDIATFSFHSTKVFHTIEGGALVIKDDDLFKRAKLKINFGIPGPDMVTDLGINCKMNEFQAAMGLCVLEDMDLILSHRKKIYKKYCGAFQGNSHIKLQKINSEASQNYSYFPVVLDSESVLLNVRYALNKEDIFPRRYFYPSLEELPYVQENQPAHVSNDISKRILCLPIYENLEEDMQDKIIEIVREASRGTEQI